MNVLRSATGYTTERPKARLQRHDLIFHSSALTPRRTPPLVTAHLHPRIAFVLAYRPALHHRLGRIRDIQLSSCSLSLLSFFPGSVSRGSRPAQHAAFKRQWVAHLGSRAASPSTTSATARARRGATASALRTRIRIVASIYVSIAWKCERWPRPLRSRRPSRYTLRPSPSQPSTKQPISTIHSSASGTVSASVYHHHFLYHYLSPLTLLFLHSSFGSVPCLAMHLTMKTTPPQLRALTV